MARKQLNIRSDEAAALASDLSRRLGSTTTDVVVRALRILSQQTEPLGADGRTDAQRKRYEALRQAAREASEAKPDDLTSDHSWLYDESGVPR